MNVKPSEAISIESPCFTEMRTALNAMLQKTIGDMVRRNSDEGTVTLKISLLLTHVSDPYQRAVIMPRIGHKITSAITVKDNLSGALGDAYELCYDEEDEQYVMRELPSEDGQMALL